MLSLSVDANSTKKSNPYFYIKNTSFSFYWQFKTSIVKMVFFFKPVLELKKQVCP